MLAELFTKESDFRPDQTKQLRGLRLILEQPNKGRIFVLRSYGKLLGMINLLFTISTAEGGAVIILEDLIIVQDHRNQGLGAQLLEYALDFARQKDFQRITLLTDRLDEPAKKFFERYGFCVSGMVPHALAAQRNADRRTLPRKHRRSSRKRVHAPPRADRTLAGGVRGAGGRMLVFAVAWLREIYGRNCRHAAGTRSAVWN